MGKKVAGRRIYLSCPFDEKDECKRLGGKWDNDRRRWYVPPHLSPMPFCRWMDDQQRQLVETYYDKGEKVDEEQVYEDEDTEDGEQDTLHLVHRMLRLTDSITQFLQRLNKDEWGELPLYTPDLTAQERYRKDKDELQEAYDLDPDTWKQVFRNGLGPEELAFLLSDDEVREAMLQ